MIHYEVFREYRFDRTFGFYETYGISAFENGRIAYTIKDISTDKDKINALTQRFNTEQLELQHMRQAIEEFLYDLEV